MYMYLSRLCKTLEELSNHSEITNSKNSGSKVQLSGHTVFLSNQSPVDVHARLPKRLLEIVATRDPPSADKTCVLTPVERPEIKNTAWIPTIQEAPPPPNGLYHERVNVIPVLGSFSSFNCCEDGAL